MSTDQPENFAPLTPEMRTNLRELRHALLDLHKIILELERTNYERLNGRVESPHAMLQLVMHDPWFGWFRPLSETVVQIDELLESKDPVSMNEVSSLLRELRSMLVPAEEGEEFAVKYHQVLQDEPDAILKHAQISKILNAAK